MLSVGSRDGRKGLGLGLELGFGGGGGGGEMEEPELEEGEAHYYQDDDEDDASMDPDVALSYLDEKLQDVLGHFQKDFEGGVSAENLGSKFGGYGSFLPSYQRSPSIWSHPRTPQKVQNNSAPKSPNNTPFEGAHQNPTNHSSASLSVRTVPGSSNVVPHVSTAAYADNLAKRDLGIATAQGAGEVTSKQDHVNKSVNETDQKTLKVRIKMGSENVLARKNAELYSGLGLDVSPSSSLEGSPTESGGLSPEFLNGYDESPMTIIQAMTSFPIPGESFLSPLHDSLLNLLGKVKLFLKDGKPGAVRKGTEERLAMLTNEFSSVKDMKGFGEKKMKPGGKNGRSMEVKIANSKDGGNDISALLKKEMDIETPEGKELVSDALKLPVLSCSNVANEKLERQVVSDTVKGTSKTSDLYIGTHTGDAKDRIFSSDSVKEEALESIANQETYRGNVGSDSVPLKGKLSSKTSSADRMSEDKKTSSDKDVLFDSRKDLKGDKSYDTLEVDSDGFKGMKYHTSEALESPKQRVTQKSALYEQDGVKMLQGGKEKVSGGKRKPKRNQSNGTLAMDLPKDNSRVAKDYLSENKCDAAKSQKISSRPSVREYNRDFIEDVKIEQAERKMTLPETQSKDKPKDSKFEAEKENHELVEKSKDRLCVKKVENPSTSDVDVKTPAAAPPLTGNRTASDAVTLPAVPVLDNWVCCDRCQKWRLLPFGTNPIHLPKKWLCTMLDWLPGMNKCSISQEETTKALNALYYVPVPESQNNYHSQHDGAATGIGLADVQHPNQSHVLGLHAIPSCAKKKNGSKNTSNRPSNTAPTPLPISIKKNSHSSVKGRSLNDANQCPLESITANKVSFEHVSELNDFSVEKQRHKLKEKHNLSGHHSDGGDYIEESRKHSKTKSRREADQDGYKTSKKFKTERSHYPDEDWHSDHDVTGTTISNLSNGFSSKMAGKNMFKQNDYSSSKDSRCDTRENLLASGKKTEDQVHVSLDGEYKTNSGDLDMGISTKKDSAVKKRKMEWQDSQIYPETLPRVSVKEEMSKSEHKKEKKVRVTSYVGKDSSSSKGDGRTDKKERVTKIVVAGCRGPVADGMEEQSKGNIDKEHQRGQYQGAGVSQQTLDRKDLLKRDSGYALLPMAATSSSSKVSSSRKTKSNFQDTKGSPVESVSSSPMRSITARRNPLGKDDSTNVDLSVMGSPRGCSDCEGDGRSVQLGTVRKKGNQLSDIKVKDGMFLKTFDGAHSDPSPSKFEHTNVENGGANTSDQHKPYPSESQGKDPDHDQEKISNHYIGNGSSQRKSGKGSSSRSRDRHKSSKPEFDKGKMKVSDSFSEQEELHPRKSAGSCRYEVDTEPHDRPPYCEEMRNGKYKEKCSDKSDKDEKNHSGKKDLMAKWSSEGRIDNRSNSDINFSGRKLLDEKSNPPQSQQQVDRTDRAEAISGKGKSQLYPLSEDKQETQSQCSRAMATPYKANRSDVLPMDPSTGDAPKVPNQPRKLDNHNGANHGSLRHPTANGLVGRDCDAPSPVRKVSSQSAATIALKEAKDLKHTANRLKTGGSERESTGLYFQAALKFLHGALLSEPCYVENAKHGDATQSIVLYSDTAKLFEFCAHEYERCKDMAAAALAYKCVEVAYMRVVYSKHSSANKDRHELQTALQTVPPGESPSSSASDVDNVNNQVTLDKVGLAKGISSPQVAGNHVIVARNRPNFVRLLNFAQDVHFAMEAIRKSHNAFAAVNTSEEEARYGFEAISSVRRVLDFNFHDVEGLLRLVRLAVDAISH